MSRIEDLIMQYHSTGVQRYSLGDLEDAGRLQLGRGKIISKKDMQSCPGDYPVYSSSATGDGEIGRYGEYMFDDERITWSIDGGGKLFYRNGIKYSVTNVGGWIKVIDKMISTKYLYYVLIDQWMYKSFDYTKKAHPSVIRDEYSVPLPNITIQNEICRILDTFTDLIGTLESELALRIKQYDFYKDYLLEAEGEEYDLEQVCQIVDCPHTSPKWREKGIPVIRNYNLVNGYIDTSNLSFVDEDEYKERVKRIVPRKDDIMFSREAPIGNVGIVPEGFPCCQGQRVVLLRPNQTVILPMFLLHILQGGVIKRQIAKVEQIGSTVSNFNITDLKKLKIHLPPLERQQLIVDRLHAFNELTGNVSDGLPAEIRNRQKQYEFYRHLLLVFNK